MLSVLHVVLISFPFVLDASILLAKIINYKFVNLFTDVLIVQVNGVSVDQLPADCIQNNVLVSPVDKSSDTFTITVQRVTIWDELLTLLQQPLEARYCLPGDQPREYCDGQTVLPSSPYDSLGLTYQSTTLMSSHGSVQVGGGHHVHHEDNDELSRKSFNQQTQP